MPDIISDFIPVEDERQIYRLYALYCHYFNHGEAEKWVSLYAPDGSFTRLNPSTAAAGQNANPAGSTIGHTALTEMAFSRREMFKGQVRHQQTDIVVTPGRDADHASGMSFILLTDWRNRHGTIRSVGDCKAEFVRLAEGWRFQSIELSTLPRS